MIGPPVKPRGPGLIPNAGVNTTGMEEIVSARSHLIRFTHRRDTGFEHGAPSTTVPETITTDGDKP